MRRVPFFKGNRPMDYKAEKITPYGKREESKTQQVREMFDSIAPVYDFMNRAMTFGIDKMWRRIAIAKLKKYAPGQILDVATGTGDLALLLHRKIRPRRIVGIDLSDKMLEIAREKAACAGLSEDVSFRQGDCLALDFSDGEFDAVTVAYGVRNFEHLEQGYREMLRVLRPGGALCVIELSTPRNPLLLALYRFYAGKIIPLAGRSISKDARAYSYLPESIAAAPQGEQMLDLMERAGFGNCRWYPLTFGVCSIYIAEKPRS